MAAVNGYINNPGRYENPYFATVSHDGEIIAIAIRTPPFGLLLSRIRDLRALEMIARDYYSHFGLLPEVNAPAIESQTFAKVWCSLTGQSFKLKLALCTRFRS
ncbi:MAG: hypothetical protein HC908_10260 [Calothrix sp. SM1_7_51]|nr:hypothetical protein [Calothrix sp. SM1_7_51]